MHWRGLFAFGRIYLRKTEVDLLTFAELSFVFLRRKLCELVRQLGKWISGAGDHGQCIFVDGANGM